MKHRYSVSADSWSLIWQCQFSRLEIL